MGLQVSNWFANARRRLKNTVTDSCINGGLGADGTDSEQPISWAKRIKLYNSHVVGNQELLSISSDDTAWEEEDSIEEEEEEERNGAGLEYWKQNECTGNTEKAGIVELLINNWKINTERYIYNDHADLRN